MSACCKLRVQLFTDAGNGWLHSVLWYHQLMLISCHFRDCKTLCYRSQSLGWLQFEFQFNREDCQNCYIYTPIINSCYSFRLRSIFFGSFSVKVKRSVPLLCLYALPGKVIPKLTNTVPGGGALNPTHSLTQLVQSVYSLFTAICYLSRNSKDFNTDSKFFLTVCTAYQDDQYCFCTTFAVYQYCFLCATASNASRVLAILQASVCVSIGHTLQPYQNAASQDHETFAVGCYKDSRFLATNFVSGGSPQTRA